MNKVILTDTGFWLGFIDKRDQYHFQSVDIAELIKGHRILFPWPCMYEAIRTKLARNRKQLLLFEEIISRPEVEKIPDTTYKENALRIVFELNRFQGHTYSLADAVIREIMKDINIRIDYLVTYNETDFRDICDQRSVEIITS